jgi:hypothetical protein
MSGASSLRVRCDRGTSKGRVRRVMFRAPRDTPFFLTLPNEFDD